MVLKTSQPFIVKDSENSCARIDGTRISVVQIVSELGSEEPSETAIDRLVRAYPNGYLSSEKVRAAWQYFNNNRAEIGRELTNGKPPAGFELDKYGNYVYQSKCSS